MIFRNYVSYVDERKLRKTTEFHVVKMKTICS